MIVLLSLSFCAHAAAKMLPKEQWLYVSDSTKTLRVYKLPLSSVPIVAALLTNQGNGSGYGMAVDHTGRVHIAEANANLIGVFAPEKRPVVWLSWRRYKRRSQLTILPLT